MVRFVFLLLFSLLPAVGGSIYAQSSKNYATSSDNIIATVHPLATDVGIEVFRKGGNAIDAAIAAAFTLGVVDGYNSGLGGGCFVLIRKPDGEMIAIDGREMAPAAARREMFIKNGKPDSPASQIGALAIGVPGAVKAYEQAVVDYGSLKLIDIVSPAATIAAKGFEVSQIYSDELKGQKRHLSRFPGTAKVLLKSDGSIYSAGDKLIQSDLAETYRSIGEYGSDWFYRGEFARKTEEWMNANSGLLTREDFANYKTVMRKPVRSSYREFEIVGFPPPSSGGVHVAQILNILEKFDLREIYQRDFGQFLHVVAEAMKLAFADRAYWLGDPDFVDVPRQLTAKEYAMALAGRIDFDRASKVTSHGNPPQSESKFFEKHTTHLTAADKQGNWIAITTTINTRFGSKVIIPGTGVVMNNQMDDFSIAPGVPNAYGLIGSENNSIAPGKRPLSSMSPTIVLKDGQPIFSTGAAGGPRIITQVVWAIINHLDLGMPVADSISQARIHHQWSPDQLMVEEKLPADLVEKLQSFGHRIKTIKSKNAGVSQAIGFDSGKGMFTGAHDPRVPGKAAGQLIKLP